MGHKVAGHKAAGAHTHKAPKQAAPAPKKHARAPKAHGHSTKDTFHPAKKAHGHTRPHAQPAPKHHGGSVRRTGGVGHAVGGNVGAWISQAQSILRAAGVPDSKMNAQDIATIIQHESGGNPTIQNNWDSNARAGHPSIGLMQTIQPTFNAYKLPGHNDIRNPVDNIIAGVRYAIARYGSISNVPGIRHVHAGGAYVGY
jgi:hypothetical protein